MFIMMLVYFFFGHYVVAMYLFFIIAIFFFFFLLRCHIFENYGLGLGLALFSLGIQVGPAMQKNFNLSWKFFQIFRENLGFETCFNFNSGMVWLG
jgi:hypothetical protein